MVYYYYYYYYYIFQEGTKSGTLLHLKLSDPSLVETISIKYLIMKKPGCFFPEHTTCAWIRKKKWWQKIVGVFHVTKKTYRGFGLWKAVSYQLYLATKRTSLTTEVSRKVEDIISPNFGATIDILNMSNLLVIPQIKPLLSYKISKKWMGIEDDQASFEV